MLLPERGVMLGNFGAAAITPNESWVTDAEFISRLVDPTGGHEASSQGSRRNGLGRPREMVEAQLAGHDIKRREAASGREGPGGS